MKKPTTFVASLLLFSCLSIVCPAMSAEPQNESATGTPTPTPKPPPSPTPAPKPQSPPTPAPNLENSPVSNEVRVVDVYRLGHEDKSDQRRSYAGIGDSIIVRVENLKSLVDRANCIDEKGDRKQGCQEQMIALFLDGMKIDKLPPESINIQPDGGILQFHLERTTDSENEWANLLGAPTLGKGFFERNTAFSAGLENEYPVPTYVKGGRFKLIRMHRWWFIGCLIGVLVLLYYLLRLARESDLLRDFGKQPPGEKVRKTYSLARCQMAFWFFLVITSYLFIWLVTNAFDIITTSVLALIGIGSGTALGAAAIEVSKSEGADSRQAQKSEGFLKDILNDSYGGVSFHRFQMFVWTIVLGMLFLYSVWKRLSMPEFGATLLALQGISAGTYLGFKIPEKQN